MHGKNTLRKIGDLRARQAATIKQRLSLKGFTLAEIDNLYELPAGTARNTLREPHLAGEKAISAALKAKPENLWRDRYHASGQRKSPQDYTRPPTLRQRRKLAEART